MTVSQAAERLGVSPARIRQFIVEGRLKTTLRPVKGNRPAHWITLSDLKKIEYKKRGRKKILATAA